MQVFRRSSAGSGSVDGWYAQSHFERGAIWIDAGEADVRFVLAISALVLSGIMLVLGIGQVTFLAGPHKVSYTEQFDRCDAF